MPGTSVTNMTDNNPYSISGFTVEAYPGLFNSASGQGTGSIDLRIPNGSALKAAGTYDATVTTDIFGNARPNPPSIGAAEYIAPSGGGNASFFHPSPF